MWKCKDKSKRKNKDKNTFKFHHNAIQKQKQTDGITSTTLFGVKTNITDSLFILMKNNVIVYRVL